ncbi:MAG: ABC transporter permease [Conexivisphaerales archaeon]
MTSRIVSGIKTALAIVWFNGWLTIKRSPLVAVCTALTPLSILFFIYLFAGSRATTFGLVGGLIASLVSSSIIVETDAAFIRLILKIQDTFVPSPVSPIPYAAGLALSDMFSGIPSLIIFTLLMLYYNPSHTFLIFIIIYSLSLAWACIAALGFFISTFARDPRDLWVYSPIITVILSFLAPVYYPISYLPSFIRPLAYLSPTTYAAELLRDAVGISNSNPYLYGIGLLIYAVILIVLAGKRMRWRDI